MARETKVTKRNWYIDILKGIACIGIIFIHCEFPGLFGGLVESVYRWAVPLFFTVSGYYCYKANDASMKRKIIHIAKIILVSAAIYLVVALLMNHSDLVTFIKSELSPINIAAFILVNSPVIINGHLWFLFALIYVYIIYWFLSVKGWINKSYILIPVLLVCYFCFSYGSRLMGMGLQGGYWRNWLFEGIPFFLLGSWIHEKQPYFKEKLGWNGIQKLLAVGILGLFVALAERLFLFSNGVHIGSVITVFALVLYSVLVIDVNGTAYHRVLELADFTALPASPGEWKYFMDEMVQKGRLAGKQRDCVSPQKLDRFGQSTLAHRMAEAAKTGTLRKEQAFFLGVPVSEVGKMGLETAAGSVSSTETDMQDELVLIQGIIDAFFEEEDGIVLLDYKTDRVAAGQELVDKYHTQMQYYTRAIEQALAKKVKEIILYSFYLEEEVPVTAAPAS